MSRPNANKYNKIRSRLIAKGYSLAGWARENGHPVTTVHLAARGLRNGIKAVAVRRDLEAFLNE